MFKQPKMNNGTSKQNVDEKFIESMLLPILDDEEGTESDQKQIKENSKQNSRVDFSTACKYAERAHILGSL